MSRSFERPRELRDTSVEEGPTSGTKLYNNKDGTLLEVCGYYDEDLGERVWLEIRESAKYGLSEGGFPIWTSVLHDHLRSGFLRVI